MFPVLNLPDTLNVLGMGIDFRQSNISHVVIGMAQLASKLSDLVLVNLRRGKPQTNRRNGNRDTGQDYAQLKNQLDRHFVFPSDHGQREKKRGQKNDHDKQNQHCVSFTSWLKR
jgi:hypothetical protein